MYPDGKTIEIRKDYKMIKAIKWNYKYVCRECDFKSNEDENDGIRENCPDCGTDNMHGARFGFDWREFWRIALPITKSSSKVCYTQRYKS